jgi:hypothetical protein
MTCPGVQGSVLGLPAKRKELARSLLGHIEGVPWMQDGTVRAVPPVVGFPSYAVHTNAQR